MNNLATLDSDFDDLIGLPTKVQSAKRTGHGGKRANSGQKSKAVKDAAGDSHVEYSRARAEHEKVKAQLAQHDLNVKSGKYVARDDVQRASAVAFATIAQTLRSIPDNLERRLGLSPAVTLQVSDIIDETMLGLSKELEALHEKASEVQTPEESIGDD